MKIELSNPINFILAGKAKFVLENTTTGNHFEYYIKLNANRSTWDIYSSKYFLGFIQLDRSLKVHRPFKEVKRSKAIFWYLSRLFSERAMPPQIHVYHLGTCGKCRRPLVDPESIELGIGPICRTKL